MLWEISSLNDSVNGITKSRKRDFCFRKSGEGEVYFLLERDHWMGVTEIFQGDWHHGRQHAQLQNN